ncbi:hypothetical protein ACIQ1D_17730 [Lysinibacillus xylanilyticus]|uniref:hypothetical protein n=1 Tax=Lysinibacillus xylanilyticus TaxID=582475 RepID=UPI00381B8FBF
MPKRRKEELERRIVRPERRKEIEATEGRVRATDSKAKATEGKVRATDSKAKATERRVEATDSKAKATERNRSDG